jgi:hypothetical protein
MGKLLPRLLQKPQHIGAIGIHDKDMADFGAIRDESDLHDHRATMQG